MKNRDAQIASQRRFYANHREQVKAQVRERTRQIAEWFREYKSQLVCEECGEDRTACLDFHHIDPSKKDIVLSHAASHGWSKKKILSEVEKCQVLCANCHRVKHAGVV